MVLQQKMTPTTADPAQARMMMTVMPVMFTFLFANFPSGLNLYYATSNLASLPQQLYLSKERRKAQASAPKPRGEGGEDEPATGGDAGKSGSDSRSKRGRRTPPPKRKGRTPPPKRKGRSRRK